MYTIHAKLHGVLLLNDVSHLDEYDETPTSKCILADIFATAICRTNNGTV
jgi:hypothetical protein